MRIFIILLMIFSGTYPIGQETVIKGLQQKYDDGLVFPGEEWSIVNPKIFNIEQSKIDSVQNYFKEIGGDALVILYKGNLIANFGNTGQAIECRSIRKSFLSACYGLYKDSIDFDLTLDAIGIDDKEKLTADEKQATIRNLLSTSSGIFHPAAYEPYGTAYNKPARGANKPGDKFFYNNWDFNTLGTIFNKLSGNDLFEVFYKDIAQKIGMQDFSLEDTEYYYDGNSEHPAYLFNISARDCARFGLLYLADGKWNDEQIIPGSWIKESTKLHFDFKNTNGYGYMWWVTTDDFNDNEWGYFARGTGGQFIYVNPYRSLVIVFRADPGTIFHRWFGLRVKWSESVHLIPMINSILKPTENGL